MELQEFVKNFEAQFDEVEPGTMTPETEFQNVEEWSSLNALLIIAMINANYNVTLNGEEIKAATTVADVFNLVESKK